MASDPAGGPAGEKLIPDPDCKTCHGQGRYVAGYSGRDDDGNAPLWEDCDCRIPAGVMVDAKPHPKCVNPDCNCVMRCEAEALPRGVAACEAPSTKGGA